MALFHFTFHAYRSWNVDRPHVRRDRCGIQSPNVSMAQHRESIAAEPQVQFSAARQLLLKFAAEQVCQTLGWQVHAVAATATHVHVVLELGDADAKTAAGRMKRVLGYKLTKASGTVGNRWFSRGTDIKRVKNAEHYAHLMTQYLPDHVKQGGQFWDLRKT